MESPGDALKSLRKACGLTQTELAKLMGLSTQFVCNIETKQRRLPAYHVRKLPPSMRRGVVNALIAEHRAAIADLRRMLNGSERT